MSVKTDKYVSRWDKRKIKDKKRLVIEHFATFVLGLLFSLAGPDESFSPFGVAFAASVREGLTVTAALGSVVGYLLAIDSVYALRYMASALALCVIMNAVKGMRQVRENTLTPAISVFVCLLSTGLAVVFADELTILGLLVCVAEAIIGGAGALLFVKCRTALSYRGGLSALTSKEATCIVVCGVLLLMSVRDISVFSVSPVNILAGLLVMISGCYNRESGGSIIGICAGTALGIGTEDVFLFARFCLGGLLSGVFSAYGKIPCLGGFILSCFITVVAGYDYVDLPSVIAECLLSSGLFMLLTYKFDHKLSALLTTGEKLPLIDSIKYDMVHRLKNASETSAEICKSLINVNQALDKAEKNNVVGIQNKTKQRVCGSCGLYDVCWGESLAETQDVFNTLLNLKKEGIYLEYKTIPSHFAGKCIRSENISSSFNRLYEEYRLKQKTEMRVRDIQKNAAEQFVNVSALLDSLCDKVNDTAVFDNALASRVKNAALACGFKPLECSCVVDTFDKMSVELKVALNDEKIELRGLSTQLELMSNRRFGIPCVERTDEYIVILFKEKTDFKVMSSGTQYCAQGEKFSGDTYSVFEDGDGFFYGILCDGMGTGNRAALASGLAVSLLEKLIKGGFGVTAAINTVNTALVSKSGDECSVTLDLVKVDLYTGGTYFYKCGASDTIVKRKGRLIKVGMSSLPMGIINDVEVNCTTGELGAGDILILTSDGVRDEDRNIVRQELKGFNGENLRHFTSGVCEKIRKQQSGKTDDLTMITMMITENE